MSDIVVQKDIGSLEPAFIASAFTAVTAGGAGDNTAVTGKTIDRFAAGSMPLSAWLIIAWSAVLAATKTFTIKTVVIEDSADGSSWASYKTFTDPGVVATGVTASGAVGLSVDLNSARRYIRCDFTPDLSNTATDTANLVAVLNLGGFDRLPAP